MPENKKIEELLKEATKKHKESEIKGEDVMKNNEGFKQEQKQEELTEIDPLNVSIEGSQYSVENGRLYRTKTDYSTGEIERKRVAPNVPVKTSRIRNIITGEALYEVKWNTPEGVRTMMVKGESLAKRSELLKLGNHALLISEANYPHISNFMNEYDLEYNDKLPVTYISSLIGRVKNKVTGEEVFIMPHDEGNIKFDLDTEDEGSVEAYEALKPKGTLDEYKKNVFDKVKHGEVAMFGIFSSFASVLLKDFGASSFTIDIAGPSSIGKTSTLRLCASVWGTPEDDEYIRTWRSTPVFIEGRTSFLNNFPLLLDESTSKTNKNMLENVIYDFSSGGSKGRGSIHGTRKSLSHNNILFSTGEFPILAREGMNKGATARVITITERPFEQDEKLFNELFNGPNSAVYSYYGTLGRHAYRKYESNKEEYLGKFMNLLEKYQKMGNSNRIISRLATPFAVIHIAGEIINDTLNENIDVEHVIEFIFNGIIDVENNLYNTETQRLDSLLNYLSDNRDRHVQYYSEAKRDYSDIWAYYDEEKQELQLLTSDTNKFLNQHGGSVANGIRQAWLEEGYTVGTGSGKSGSGAKDTKTVRLPDRSRKRVIIITKDVLDKFNIDFDKISNKESVKELLESNVIDFKKKNN